MKLQCNIKAKSAQFGNTGKKILGLMQDKETNPIDLLVREVIQNSSDAIVPNSAHYGGIRFSCTKFRNLSLSQTMDDDTHFGQRFLKRFGNERTCECLVIQDFNTQGLCGLPYRDIKIKQNNLFNLVYDVLNDNKGNNAGTGGSHGIGKTVYYRFGAGLVFYYSHTKEENGQSSSKLAGLFLEDTEKPAVDHIMDFDSSGIVLLGRDEDHLGETISAPIQDEEAIEEFLSIFGLKPYEENKYGTTIIIPYIRYYQFFDKQRYDFDDIFSFENELFKSLRLSIQRWYFPRINNPFYKGDYLRVWVNGDELSLNPFFKKFQDLYNGQVENAKSITVSSKPIFEPLGTFYYKIFSKEELQIDCPPNNYPSPYIQVGDNDDSKNDDGNEPILCYTRRPGMIINYDYYRALRGFHFKCDEDAYLLGIFVVNNACKDNFTGKTLDDYLKDCERDNHKEWKDIVETESSSDFSRMYPPVFKKITSEISQQLKKEFTNPVQIVPSKVTETKLQKDLGEALLPPEDFGKGASKPSGRDSRGQKKNFKDPCKIVFLDFTGTLALPTYEIVTNIKPKNSCTISFCIQAEGKKRTFEDWIKLGFDLPYSVNDFTLESYGIVGEKTFNPNSEIVFDNGKFTIESDSVGIIGSINTHTLRSEIIDSITIKNTNDEKIHVVLKITMALKSLDYQIGFNVERQEDTSDAN